MESGKCQDYVSGNSGMCRCSGMELVVVVVWVVVFVVVWVVIVNHDGDDGLLMVWLILVMVMAWL
jgi:hypothetical protein